jgi:hypothetical protein
MPTFLIQLLIFIAGFSVGYALCAWRSRRRGGQYPNYKSRNSAPLTSTFGHARRAF